MDHLDSSCQLQSLCSNEKAHLMNMQSRSKKVAVFNSTIPYKMNQEWEEPQGRKIIRKIQKQVKSPS